jgi:ribose 5-phosphate isomerase B
MKIAIASDHGGFNLKEIIKKHLEGRKIEVKDFGTFSIESCDYTDFALTVAESVARGEYDKGILVCGTGIGMSIAANKVKGIRAAHVTDTFSAKACVEHNNANIITIGERITGPGIAIDIIETFLSAEFQGGRHQRRIDKIAEIENKYMK